MQQNVWIGLALKLTAVACLPLAVTAARAGEPPKLKEGLWVIHVQSVEQPGDKRNDLTYKLCRDHAYDKFANDQLKNLPGCTTVIKDAGDGKFISASNCSVNGTVVVSNGFTTFVTKKITHSETQAKYTPPFRGKSDESMIQDQQYVGDCPSGLKPGDTIGADGLIRHRN